MQSCIQVCRAAFSYSGLYLNIHGSIQACKAVSKDADRHSSISASCKHTRRHPNEKCAIKICRAPIDPSKHAWWQSSIQGGVHAYRTAFKHTERYPHTSRQSRVQCGIQTYMAASKHAEHSLNMQCFVQACRMAFKHAGRNLSNNAACDHAEQHTGMQV